MEPCILSIETSSTICSVALSRGEAILSVRESLDGLAIQHVALFIQEVCNEAGIPLREIDAVACSQGPGSFSALRTGLATGKSICLSLDKPLILVSSLKTFAWVGSRYKPGQLHYIVSIGARRDEVYLAIYDAALAEILSPRVEVINPEFMDKMPQFFKQSLLTGVNTQLWEDLIPELEAQRFETQYSAQHMVHLALEAFRNSDFADLDQAVPLYIKDPHITIPKIKIHN